MAGDPYPRPPCSRKVRPEDMSADELRDRMRWKIVPVGCDPHHILYAQTLRHHGHSDKLWDLRNRMILPRSTHARHHAGFAPILFEQLPVDAIQFAKEVGLYWWLEQHYPRREAEAA